MIDLKLAKKSAFLTAIAWSKIFAIASVAVSAISIYSGNAQAQSLAKPGNILLAQSLGGIVRKIPLQEVPATAMSAAKTASGADFTAARAELKSDGSLVYIVRGKNQQGFEVEVQVSSIGTILQVDEQVELSAVPEIAVKAFKTWAPNAQLLSTWRSTRLGESYYQFVIPDFWLEVSTDANKVIIYRKLV